MKELIGIAVVLVGLFEGSAVIKNIHAMVRKAALEKAAKGLPSLVQLNRSIRASPKPRN